MRRRREPRRRDDQTPPEGAAVTGFFNGNWHAQSFRPTGSNVSGVGYLLRNFGNTSPTFLATYQLWDRRPDLTGAVLRGMVTSEQALPAPGGEYVDVFFPDPIAVVPGATYFVTASGTNAGGIGLAAAQGNAYPSGELYVRRSGDLSYSPNSTFDLTFRTFTSVDATVVPEPATVALTATGLLALGGVAARRRQRSR